MNEEIREIADNLQKRNHDLTLMNERLEQQIEAYKLSENEAKEIIAELEHENKELKEEITKFRWDNPYYVLYNNVVGQRDNLERENEELKARLIALDDEVLTVEITLDEFERYKKYKQTLEEIREMINEQKPPLDKVISQSEFTLERLCVYEEKYIKVVDKINEVLNEKI